MIIVSQNKTEIVNFNNITQIYISQDKEETAYFIRFETICETYENLGEYATEKRAREVLEEIIENIQGESSLTMDSDGVTSEVTGGIYRMPKE